MVAGFFRLRRPVGLLLSSENLTSCLAENPTLGKMPNRGYPFGGENPTVGKRPQPWLPVFGGKSHGWKKPQPWLPVERVKMTPEEIDKKIVSHDRSIDALLELAADNETKIASLTRDVKSVTEDVKSVAEDVKSE